MFQEVTGALFGAYFTAIREAGPRPEIAAATSPFVESHGARYFLDADDIATRGIAGYVIREDGDLTNVFATSRGRGDEIVADAVANGAETLDCFDGYLPTLYARHGFRVYRRESNWTPGGPDVVYMVRCDCPVDIVGTGPHLSTCRGWAA